MRSLIGLASLNAAAPAPMIPGVAEPAEITLQPMKRSRACGAFRRTLF